MHIRFTLPLPMLALALFVSSYAFAKDEAKIQLPLPFSKPVTSVDQKVCENKLEFVAFQPQWKAMLPELASPAVIYAHGSKVNGYQQLSPEMAKEAAAQGLSIELDSEHGDITIYQVDRQKLREDAQLKARIPLKEPFSKIEYFPAGNSSGFIAIVGWTRVHYYEYRGGKVTECEEQELRDFNPMWDVTLYPLPLKVERQDHDEIEVTDSRGQKIYLGSKRAKNLAQAMGVTSFEFASSHPISITMKDPRFPGQHAVEFFESWYKAQQAPINKLTDIFTKAAMDVARLQSPDFSEFFGPMVDLAFSYEFRNAVSGQHFVNELTKVIVQASKGTVRPVAGFHAIPGDRDIAQFQDPSGAQYLLRYQPFSSSPLKLERIP